MELDSDIVRVKQTNDEDKGIKVYLMRREDFNTRKANKNGFYRGNTYDLMPFYFFDITAPFQRMKFKREEYEKKNGPRINFLYRMDGWKVWTFFSGFVIGAFFVGMFIGNYFKDKDCLRTEGEMDSLRDSLRHIPLVRNTLIVPDNKSSTTTTNNQNDTSNIKKHP